MKKLKVNVDGINETIDFDIQKDNWFFNEQYHLLIDPELSYCISEQDNAFSVLSGIEFRVLET